MRNDELFSPRCPDKRVKNLVLNYALREALDSDKCYTDKTLLAVQHRIYEEWLAAVRETKPGFTCCFYEWMARSADSALIFKTGDLVKYKGRYCVVVRQPNYAAGWERKWRITNITPALEDWPLPLTTLGVKDADGRVCSLRGLDASLEPADIPPEVFALACGRAKDCPILKGGRDGE